MQAEVHRWASELARLHERRDKEIVEIQRYEMVQGIVYQDPSTNRFHVRSSGIPYRPAQRIFLSSCDVAAHADVLFGVENLDNTTASHLRGIKRFTCGRGHSQPVL